MALLDGKRALVTGASAGLGAGVARELVARGARVLMSSRSTERIQAAAVKIAEEIKTSGPAPGTNVWQAPITLAADVTLPAAAATLAEAARKALGGLDILVCSAGGPPPGDFSELDDAQWEAAFRLIMLAPIRLIRTCLPLLRESGAGRIVLMSSVSGIRPVKRLLLSNALRPGLTGLARHLAGELAADRILINTIAPGYFDTERAREVQEAIARQAGREPIEIAEETWARIPLRRPGSPEELGRLVGFLASEENTFITGQTLVIDGGMTVAAE
ncbi:MAG: SDR family oxidoreductase [Candidatus Eisenbacteria sp.]|nr:SDR family oxidoreductase [Candidatus Eisenbacteria bacterium]